MNQPKVIKLNVGGQKFVTTYDTLMKSGFFRIMFEEYEEKNIFIDKSPKIFSHVLDYLRDNTYPYPEKYENELKFYLIDYDKNTLHTNKCAKCKQCNHCKYFFPPVYEENNIKYYCDEKIKSTSNFCSEHENGNECIAKVGRKLDDECGLQCEIGFNYCSQHC